MHVTNVLLGLATSALAINLNVASSGGNASSPLSYGLMFEDINHSGDGGLYAELISNRAFQSLSVADATIEPWYGTGGATLNLQTAKPLSKALPISVKVNVPTAAKKGSKVGIVNPGYWGIDVQPQPYTGFFWVRGSYNGSFTASLSSNLTGKVFASTTVPSKINGTAWTRHNYTLTPSAAAPNSNNSLTLTFDPAGLQSGTTSLDFNLISLFPPTYKNRPNGMRKDLMEALKATKPSFLRFPGGNNLEGQDPPYYWKWNQTIGPLTQRPGRPGTWEYFNTDGLGLAEYLHWCEDLAIEPILAVWSGFYLDGTAVSKDALQPYVQEALDMLEYVLGDAKTTKLGALRASHGRTQPWVVKYVEIGNEDNLNGGYDTYQAYRYQAFYKAINAKYPSLSLIASTIDVDLATNAMGDYHIYSRPNYFVSQFNFFDQKTSAHRTFIGEYANVQPNVAGDPSVDFNIARLPFPSWIGTVSEAVFLIGAERNSDAIFGAAYAPILQNLNSYEWAPDLISFTADPKQTVKSTSHHMVVALSSTRFTETLPVKTAAKFGPAYWVAGKNTDKSTGVFKAAVYNSTAPVPVTVAFAGLNKGVNATLTVLTAPNGDSFNSIGKDVVKTSVQTLVSGTQGYTFSLPALSIAVMETAPDAAFKKSTGKEH